MHLPRAYEQCIAGLDDDPAAADGGFEVVAGDRVVVVEILDAVRTGHVDEDSPGHHRAEVLDSQPGRAAPRPARRRRRVVVELAVVAGVRQRVPVRNGLRSHTERVVAGGEVAGVARECDVDGVGTQLGIRALGHVHVVPLRAGLIEREREREHAAAARAAEIPRRTTSGVMRLSVPRWSSAPQRPQFDTRAANCSRSAVSGMERTLALPS